MTILVGYPINRRAKAVLNLAGMLSRTGGEKVVVCVVIPAPWMPGLSRADHEYRAYVNEQVAQAIAQAREDMPDDVSVEFVSIPARSAPRGLLEAAKQYEASVITVGSSPAGQFGYIALSSVADRLLHSSPISVAVANRGFRSRGGKVGRITLGFSGGEQSGLLLDAAEALATRFGAEVRLAAFAVELSPPLTARFRAESHELVAEWTDNIRSAARRVVQPGDARRPQAAEPEVVIGYGPDWQEALWDVEWRNDDLLMIGSSEAGPIARVFLGSRATKMVRHSPVPVVVVPRGAAAELAEV